MDWTTYAAIAAAVIVGVFIHGFFGRLLELKNERNEAWQRLSDAFDGVTIRRVMDVVPRNSADRLDYDGFQFLGAFELTNGALRFYRAKIKNGSIIEFPVDRIRESNRIANHNEPAATLTIEAPDGRRFTIDASVPEGLCARLIRFGNGTGSSQS